MSRFVLTFVETAFSYFFPLLNPFSVVAGLARLEKYLNLEGFLEKCLWADPEVGTGGPDPPWKITKI